MAIEQRVSRLESQFDSLDHCVRDLITVVNGTHDLLSIFVNEQRVKFKEQESRFDRLEREIAELRQENRNRFDQLELLFRQHFTAS